MDHKSEGGGGELRRKPRILCLHGHGSSGDIMKEMLKERWPEDVVEKMDLVYINAPFLVADSALVGQFDPPYYEWMHTNKAFSEIWDFNQTISYLEDCMLKLGPFDGILAVSEGAIVAATLPGMQREGVALTRVPKIKFLILISGAKLGGPTFPAIPELAKHAFSLPIDIPSLFIIGEKDRNKQAQFQLMESFTDTSLIYHHEGHGVPHLDDEGVIVFLNFLLKVQKLLQRSGETMRGETRKLHSSCCGLFSCFYTKKSIIWFKKKSRVQDIA